MKTIIDTTYPNNQTSRLAVIESHQGNEIDYKFEFWLNSSYFKFHSIAEFQNALIDAARWKELKKNLVTVNPDEK